MSPDQDVAGPGQINAGTLTSDHVEPLALLSRILHWLIGAMLLAMLFIGVSMVASLGN